MRHANQIDGCQIWIGFSGVGYWNRTRTSISVEYSPRAGGKYVITQDARLMIADGALDDSHKARLTTLLVDQRQSGIEWPEVRTTLIERAKSTPPLVPEEQADRLLRFLVMNVDSIGKWTLLNREYAGEYAMAWTESTDLYDLNYLLSHLTSRKWIEVTGKHYRATIEGYSRVSNLGTNVDSAQSFIAMWFDDSTTEYYEKGIEPAVKESGYNPLRIDRKEHINKIDDEIIEEIRRSRFLVADFTQGSDGARGGVYYEAGFAHGIDLPVIFTCHKDSLKKLHFDTRHYNHIVWSTPEELREKLKNRILAVIGEGPEVNNSP